MKSSTKISLVGLSLGMGAVALLAPTLASGSARNTVGSGAAAAAVATPFLAQLTGGNEVPGPGDTDGAGAAAVTIDPVTGEICADLRASNIQPAVAAHIHRGAAGVSGPIVVPFTPPNPISAVCVMVTPALAAEIADNPSGFYVNVHTGDFPNGAMRGQLGPSLSSSGSTQLLNEPLRAYDSRNVNNSILPPQTTRVVSLAQGLNSAGASVLAVPPGATGALIRVTVTDTVGAGFLKVYSNALGVAPQTSNVNWYESGAITGADLTVSVDPDAKIKITSGPQSTHVVVDVVGYVF